MYCLPPARQSALDTYLARQGKAENKSQFHFKKNTKCEKVIYSIRSYLHHKMSDQMGHDSVVLTNVN